MRSASSSSISGAVFWAKRVAAVSTGRLSPSKTVVCLGSSGSSSAWAGTQRGGPPSKEMCQPAGASVFRIAHSSMSIVISRVWPGRSGWKAGVGSRT